jgi:hypothetical protein
MVQAENLCLFFFCYHDTSSLVPCNYDHYAKIFGDQKVRTSNRTYHNGLNPTFQPLIATVLLVVLLPFWSFLRNHETHLVGYPDPSLSSFAGISFGEQHAIICREMYLDCVA